MKSNIETLSNLIYKAAKNIFLELFNNNEQYYYAVLLTTEEGLSPIVSAWSLEALERLTKEKSEEYSKIRKWSYADSPYYNFGSHYFNEVKSVFNKLPTIDELDDIYWNNELETRLLAMETAIKRLDNDGIFEMNQKRSQIYINVELMPPDKSNTDRAIRLNKLENITDWIKDMSEYEYEHLNTLKAFKECFSGHAKMKQNIINNLYTHNEIEINLNLVNLINDFNREIVKIEYYVKDNKYQPFYMTFKCLKSFIDVN